MKWDIDSFVERKWYTQGLNGTPLLIVPCGCSGFFMEPYIGTAFDIILFDIKDDYGKMYYPRDELDRLGKVILDGLRKDKDYLKNLRKESERLFYEGMKEFHDLDWENLKNLSDDELLKLLNRLWRSITVWVAPGHVIEPFALTTDVLIRDKLREYTGDKRLNECLSLLSTPTEKSFINESEDMLHCISLMDDGEEKNKKIKEYIDRFYWLRNTYAGRFKMTVNFVEKELQNMKTLKPINFDDIKKRQDELIRELKLDDELIFLLEQSNFVTSWQDKRKEMILIGLDYIDKFLEELSERKGIDIALLRYLVPHEVNEEVFDGDIKEKLEERRKGVLLVTYRNNEDIVVGDGYARFHKEVDKVEIEEKNISGMCASTGVAIGRVKICKSLQDIEDFRQGEILVSSMTRPEYLPAMKKAAAIVTDEGGITCHAAIVSRELGIPCIIGTKVATDALNNGDLVEVKANHNMIRVLERAK